MRLPRFITDKFLKSARNNRMRKILINIHLKKIGDIINKSNDAQFLSSVLKITDHAIRDVVDLNTESILRNVSIRRKISQIIL